MAGITKDVVAPQGDGVPARLKGPPLGLVEVAAGGFHWWVHPEQGSLLLGPDGLRLAEWIQAGRARIVKKGPHRIVYRVDLPELSFFVKHNLMPDWPTWLRGIVRPSKARLEFDRAGGVSARGVATFSVLALGEQKVLLGAGESFLITRTLEDTQPLHVFAAHTLSTLPAGRQTRLRRQLALELAKLVARMHDAGIQHDDLHAGNLLVRLKEDDRLELFLIDLNSVRLGSPLSWAQSRANLILLNRWFILRASRADRLRFWQAYRSRRRLGRGCTRLAGREALAWADDIEKRTWKSNLAFWKSRDPRCLKNNRYYRRVRCADAAGQAMTGHAVTDLDERALYALMADPDEPFRRPGVKLLKDSPSSTVAELDLRVDGQLRRIIYKRFRVTTWTDPWTALVRPTPALRSWVQGQSFRERGLPTARPLAVFHRQRHGLLLEGYCLTEKIQGTHDLHGFVADIQKLPPRERARTLRRRIVQVAQVIHELHRRGLAHRDLKAANILVSRDLTQFLSPFSSRAWASNVHTLLPIFATSVWLIDLVGVERHDRLPRSRMIQNLTRLNASFFQSPFLTRSDRLRFLRDYLSWEGPGAADWKEWWKAIDQATQAKAARNQRRGRPLA